MITTIRVGVFIVFVFDSLVQFGFDCFGWSFIVVSQQPKFGTIMCEPFVDITGMPWDTTLAVPVLGHGMFATMITFVILVNFEETWLVEHVRVKTETFVTL